jgi:hypothetical protein
MIKNIYHFYMDGFRSMRLGRTLWRLILVKLAVIVIVLNYLVYDRSLNSLYKTVGEKSDFVYRNLTQR